jgi:hypothetical protein
MNLQFHYKGRLWSVEERQEFIDDWCNSDLSIVTLSHKYNRTEHALYMQAYTMNLPNRQDNRDYLTVNDIACEMNVSDTTVRNWYNKGLKVKKTKIGRFKQIIYVEDLLKFLKKHQDIWDASIVSEYLFSDEPKWFKEKREKDKEKHKYIKEGYWTDDETRRLESMLKMGKTYESISKTLSRSADSCRTRAKYIGIAPKTKIKHWTEEEITYLKENADKFTNKVLAEHLQGRTPNAIGIKCSKLNLNRREN